MKKNTKAVARVGRVPKSQHGDLPRKTATGDAPAPVNYTPAPWVARMQRSRAGEALGFIIETESTRGGRIGWVDRAFADTNEGAPREDPENVANACLVAAAPELLAALKALRDDENDRDHTACVRYEAEGVGDNTDVDEIDHRCWLCRVADAAIAKAEGR